MTTRTHQTSATGMRKAAALLAVLAFGPAVTVAPAQVGGGGAHGARSTSSPVSVDQMPDTTAAEAVRLPEDTVSVPDDTTEDTLPAPATP